MNIIESKFSQLRRVVAFAACLVLVISCFARSGLLQAQEHTGAFGSVAVAVVRADTIAVSAESRTMTDGVVNPDTTCKMTIVNDIIFATTGLIWGRISAIGILDYARSVLLGPGKREDKLRTFQAGASTLLTSWLNQRPFRDSLEMSWDYRYKHSIHAMFCFFSGNKPVIVEYTFTPSWTGSQFKVSGIYDAGKRRPGEIIWIGAMEQTDSLMKNENEMSKHINELDALSAGKALIQKQMEFTPRIVGGAVDIAVVTPAGAKWIRKKQNCY